jgi:hypothetical protein
LLRGYPIALSFWRVDEDHKADYQFYEFIRDFEQSGSHNQKASMLRPEVVSTAVLDGQQRLTLSGCSVPTERRKSGTCWQLRQRRLI